VLFLFCSLVFLSFHIISVHELFWHQG
jgi:hypothetical protein